MKFNLKTSGFRIDDALRAWVDRKIVKTAEKLLEKEERMKPAILDIEIEKETRHHRKGRIWRAEGNLSLPGRLLRAEVSAEDIRSAVDMLEEEISREIKKYKERYVSRLMRGARAAKKELKYDPASRGEKGKRDLYEGN